MIQKSQGCFIKGTLALVAASLLCSPLAQADARTQAKRLHDRLAGVPPTSAKLTQMAALIGAGGCAGGGEHRHAGTVLL
jgi:hypothetical protein